MPIEIKELNIKVTVADSGSAGNTSSGAGNTSADSQGGGTPDSAVVDACVEKILEILKHKMER
jgi:Family of unknown function (DUF5908)